MMRRYSEAVWVEAPARLHLGLLDLRGDLGRRFGAIGMAVREPSLLLEARHADGLRVEGEAADRVREHATRFLEFHGIHAGVELRVHRAIPARAGLGSGSQSALATARALAALFERPSAPEQLAAAVGRGRRSAIATSAFGQGGFLLEGARTPAGDATAPLLLRKPMPEGWRCVLAIPHVPQGMSGSVEEGDFRHPPPPSATTAGRIARLVLTQLLPSLVERDLQGFGRAVTEVQQLVGQTFQRGQGGAFTHPLSRMLVEDLLAWGAAGAGQSSWGPAVCGFVGGEEQAEALALRLRKKLGGRGVVRVVAFDNRGARCWRAPHRPDRPHGRVGAAVEATAGGVA
jgi:beta-ribofuranosylaminobenzene 5'-phosphate synthase